MLFASCNQTDTPTGDTDGTKEDTTSGTETETEAKTEKETDTEFVPVDEDVDYSVYINQWTKYLAYNEKSDTAPKVNISKLFDNEGGTAAVSYYGSWVAFSSTKYMEGNDSYRQSVVNVYSLIDGSKLMRFESGYFDVAESAPKTIGFKSIGSQKGILEVKRGDLTNIGTDEAPVYEYKYTYSYYSQDGACLARDLEESSATAIGTPSGADLVTINDKCYFCRDEEVLHTFNKGEERDIPSMNLEYGDYKYKFNSDSGVMTVFDSEYNVVGSVNIPVPSGSGSGSGMFDIDVLDNGDIYVQTISEGDDNNYDFETQSGYKVKVDQLIFHVDTMTTEKIDNVKFAIMDMMTKATGDFERYSFKLKEENECQLVAAYKIDENKQISNEISFLIVDNSLGIIAELPNIIKNQTGFEGFISETQLVVVASNYNGQKDISYVVDTVDATVSLYVNTSHSSYEKVNGGFIYDDILYNDSMQELADLRYVDEYEVKDGNIVVVEKLPEPEESETETETETETIYPEGAPIAPTTPTAVPEYKKSVYYISDGELVKTLLCYDTDSCVYYSNSKVFTVSNSEMGTKLYSIYGEELASADYISFANDHIVICKNTYSDVFGTGSSTDVYSYYILK